MFLDVGDNLQCYVGVVDGGQRATVESQTPVILVALRRRYSKLWRNNP